MRVSFLLLLTTIAWAQCPQVGIPTLYRIQGYVVTMDETPVTGAKVEIFTTKSDGSAGALVHTVTTDKRGRFSVKGKEGMQYELRIQHEGRQFRGVRANAGSPVIRRSPGFQNLLLMIGKDPCPALSLAP